MADIARNSIEYGESILLKILQKMITDKFLGIIPDEFDVNHSLGYFFGKNFKFVQKASERFLSSSIYSYDKSHGYFIRGFLEGIKIGSIVPSRELQLAVL